MPGTSVKAFETFIKTLPDKGTSEKMIYGHSSQHYVTWETTPKAKEVCRRKIVDQMMVNKRQRNITDEVEPDEDENAERHKHHRTNRSRIGWELLSQISQQPLLEGAI